MTKASAAIDDWKSTAHRTRKVPVGWLARARSVAVRSVAKPHTAEGCVRSQCTRMSFSSLSVRMNQSLHTNTQTHGQMMLAWTRRCGR